MKITKTLSIIPLLMISTLIQLTFVTLAFGVVFSGVAFSPNGERLATGSSDGSVYLWNANTGKHIRVFKAHTQSVMSVAFSPNGDRLATGGKDGSAHLWNANTGKHIRGWNSVGVWSFQEVWSVAFSPDGKQLAIGTLYAGAQIWNTNTGQLIHELNTGTVRSLAFRPDGKQKQLATAGYYEAQLWNANTGERIWTSEKDTGGSVSVAFSPDGDRLATGGEDGSVHLWNANTGERIWTSEGDTGFSFSVAFSPDGDRLATGSKNEIVHLWNANTGERIWTSEGATWFSVSVAFSPDGDRLATGILDGSARLFNANTGVRLFNANTGVIDTVTDSTEDIPDATASVTVSIAPSPIQSPVPGKQLVLNLNITGGEDVAGYQATLQFDTTALRYISSSNADYLPAGAFVVPTLVNDNQVTLAATSLTGGSQGDGTLATLTFEVIAVKPSMLTLSGVELTDTNADFLSVRSENGEVVTSGAPTETSTPTEAVMRLTPSPVASPASGEQLTFNVSLMNGKNVAGYAFKLTFDATALRYISGGNAGYLPAGAVAVPPVVDENQITFVASSPNAESQGDGTLATVTFDVIAAKPSTLRFSAVSLTDGDAKTLRVRTENGEIVAPIQIPGDVNSDGVVNLEDMDAAAARVGQKGKNTADMNGDGVVDGADLLLIAAAIEQANAAPSLRPESVAEMFTATEVRHWLQLAQQAGLTDPMYQRGFLFLEQLLAILIPEETAVLPNYPNPFNPETWIPYHLSKSAEVHISIYAADGKLVRRLRLGHQPAGIYESRSRAAYWDGRNDWGEPVASGVYFYTLTAGDFAATRKLLIRK